MNRWAACIRAFGAGLLLVLSAPHPASAAEKTPFLDAVHDAYPHLKMAWFYTRTRSGAVAVLEIAAFQEKWAAIGRRFATAPPPRFATDERWRETLSAISAAAGRALDDADAARFKDAHRALNEVRRALSDLRRRNNIVVFSDLVDAYGGHVARLTAVRTELKTLGRLTSDKLAELRGIVAALRQAVRKIRDRAPAKLTANPAFRAAIEGNLKSIAKLERGVRRKSLKAVRGSVSAVRSDYVLLFTRYG